MRTRLPKRCPTSVAVLAAFTMMLTACGDGSSNPVFATTGDQATSTSQSGSPGTTRADGTTGTTSASATTTAPPVSDLLDLIANADFTPSGEAPGSLVGTPDTRAATSIADDLVADGVDLTGVEVWVFPVVGTDERLLVFEVNPTAAALSEDPTGGALFEALAAAPSLPNSGVTRFVLNYHDGDDEGDFILTTTVPLDLLLDSIANGTDVSESVVMQLLRDGVAQ